MTSHGWWLVSLILDGGSAATALLRGLVFVRMKSCALRATPLVVARRCGWSRGCGRRCGSRRAGAVSIVA